MKKLLCLVLIALGLAASAQTIRKYKRVSKASFHIWGDDFEGVVFTDKYKGWRDDSKLFTPLINDIELADACMRQSIDTVVTKGFYFLGLKKTEYADSGKWVIPPLECYVRQYWGYYNKKGEKIIFINCFHQYNHYYLDDRKGWLNDILCPFDGGPTYWRVYVNLNTMQVFNFSINR